MGSASHCTRKCPNSSSPQQTTPTIRASRRPRSTSPTSRSWRARPKWAAPSPSPTWTPSKPRWKRPAQVRDAAKELKAITDDLTAQFERVKDAKTPAERATRAKLEKTLLRAELATAPESVRHRPDVSPRALQERSAARAEPAGAGGGDALLKIAGREDAFSEVWQARAWVGRCEQESGKPKTARERFVPVIEGRNPAAADGIRLARYFRLLVIQEQLTEGGAEKGENLETLIDGCRRWMRDYPRSLATPEGYGIRYLLAETYITVGGFEKTPAAQKKEYQTQATALLGALEKTENEFTDRARRKKILLLGQQGVFNKPVTQLRDV